MSRILGVFAAAGSMTQYSDSLNSDAEAVYCPDDGPCDAVGSSRYERVDLHCHSLCSDGSLPVSELINRAAAAGLKWFSITDHDTLQGQEEARALAAQTDDLHYVTGVEWSAVWNGVLVHLVGLDFDPNHPASQTAATRQLRARRKRAVRIAQKLDRNGFSGVEDWVRSEDAPELPGRPHFARHLVATGQIGSVDQAFRRFLGAGKAGDVKSHWPEMAEVIDWVHAAGGQVVLAHPQRYKLTGRKRRQLVADFAEAGGDALEIAVPGMPPNTKQLLVELCVDHGLAGSSGSDFHDDSQHWLALGQVPALPRNIQPIWEKFAI